MTELEKSTARRRLRQILAVVRLELRRLVKARRLVVLALLNMTPVILLLLSYLAPVSERSLDRSPAGLGGIYAVLFSTWVLYVAVFFTSASLAIQLFRTESLEKTLHYYLLAPVRREIVVAGKLLAGATASAVICCVAVVGSYLALFGWMGGGLGRFLLSGPGAGHLLAYLGVTVLGCVAYSAVFTLTGLLWKNPMLAIIALFGWESALFLLPPFLKAASVLFYLQSLLPVHPPSGPLAILADPPSAIASVAGLLAFTAVVLALAAWRSRHMEIAYSTD
jgi:ABC-type transport system involved in multi-copper enzyme maturation permease subunit